MVTWTMTLIMVGTWGTVSWWSDPTVPCAVLVDRLVPLQTLRKGKVAPWPFPGLAPHPGWRGVRSPVSSVFGDFASTPLAGESGSAWRWTEDSFWQRFRCVWAFLIALAGRALAGRAVSETTAGPAPASAILFLSEAPSAGTKSQFLVKREVPFPVFR